MSKKLVSQLKSIKSQNSRINPDLSWVTENRNTLMAKIKQDVAEGRVSKIGGITGFLDSISQALRVFVPYNIRYLARATVAVLLVATITVSGWIATVSASQNSLPGEKLYNVKIATERTELIVTSVIGSNEDQVAALLRHASIRVDEFKKVKESSPGDATKAIKSLKQNIESTSKYLEKAQQKPKYGETTSLARSVEEKTSALLTSLNEGKTENVFDNYGRQIVPSKKQGVEELSKQLKETTELIEVTSVRAVEVLIEQGDSGDKTIDRQSVKDSVTKKLDKLVTDIEALQQTVVNVKEDMVTGLRGSGEIQNVAPGAGSVTTVVQVELPVGGTALVTTTDAIAIEKVKEVGVGLNKTDKLVEETVAEVKILISNDDLKGAIHKVQELNILKNEAKTAVVETQKITGKLITDAETKIVNSVDVQKEVGVVVEQTLTTPTVTSGQTTNKVETGSTGTKL